jgi:hypothetical protein
MIEYQIFRIIFSKSTFCQNACDVLLPLRAPLKTTFNPSPFFDYKFFQDLIFDVFASFCYLFEFQSITFLTPLYKTHVPQRSGDLQFAKQIIGQVHQSYS